MNLFFSSHSTPKDPPLSPPTDSEEKGKEPTSATSAFIETVGSMIDRYIFTRTLLFALLVALFVCGFIGLVLSLAVGPHYCIAIAVGVVLLSTLFFYSLIIYCKEESHTLLTTIEGMIESGSHSVHSQLEERGQMYLKAALSLQKKGAHLFKTTENGWHINLIKQLLAPLASIYIWIPYTYFSEQLYHCAKRWYITQIRQKPKEMKLHAALANIYVTLSNHLKDAYDMKETLPLRGALVPKKVYEKLYAQHELASKRAIQELLILRSFAPEEVWVLDQLAISFRELGMIDQEKEIYETLLQSHPDDTNAIFRLGSISFLQGDNARGLEMYDLLLYLQPLLAHDLISTFGVYDLQDPGHHQESRI